MSHHSLPQYSRNQASTTVSSFGRKLAALPSELVSIVQRTLSKQRYDALDYNGNGNGNKQVPKIPRTLRQVLQKVSAGWRGWLNLPNACILVWVFVLLWGERWIFQNSLKACEWSNWERWPKAATPHRMVLLTDPQLVDPHTYAGRPWPLDVLTMMHTDNYMKRTFVQAQQHLHPDTVFFLGDLFDGGREWQTRNGSMDDPPWVEARRSAMDIQYSQEWRKIYGEDYWLEEYERFNNIFFKHWNDYGDSAALEQRGRKIITGLPGNHDIGFGTNVRVEARRRFQAYFGETNRVDVIGNHSFVSLDVLSLSARSMGIPETKAIAKPVEEFLLEVPAVKRRAFARELKYRAGEPETLLQSHTVEDVDGVVFDKVPTMDPGEGAPKLPTVLFSHIPLYRDRGAACGPMRERMPPADPPISPDERNGIPIAAGYQYQNVLSNTDSLDILERVEDVVHVFSGDDHDYCELVHTPAQGGVKEITVKSMSWAMGVKEPGFLLVSLWNPIDASGQTIGTHGGHGAMSESGLPLTIETHLCLLPDQISILLRYAALLGATLIILIARAILVPILSLTPFSPTSSSPLRSRAQSISLPTYSPPKEVAPDYMSLSHRDSDSSTSSTSSNSKSGSSRGARARTRSITVPTVSPSRGYGLPPSPNRNFQSSSPLVDRGYYAQLANAVSKKNDNYEAGAEEAEWGNGKGLGRGTKGGRRRPLTRADIAWREVWTSVWRVAWVVVGWYLWLVWKG